MKHLKKFFENNKIKISYVEATDWIVQNYSKERVIDMLDEEINSGNWTDREQMEEEGYDSEYDYYIDYGRGEAESEVMSVIVKDLKLNFDLDFDELGNDTDIYDFIKDTFELRT